MSTSLNVVSMAAVFCASLSRRVGGGGGGPPGRGGCGGGGGSGLCAWRGGGCGCGGGVVVEGGAPRGRSDRVPLPRRLLGENPRRRRGYLGGRRAGASRVF